jgi:sialate O-acetylesterase
LKKIVVLLLLVAVLKGNAQLPLRLPSIISNHAVLQQASEVKLWGWGPGSFKLCIVCSWQPIDTIAVQIGADCMWESLVKTPKAGGPYNIQFLCGKQKLTVTDIVIGEVWLCSGQSNMEFNFHWGVSDAGDALQTCDNREIRFFQVTQSYDKYPQSDCRGEWKVCQATSAADFSAVGYFFGRSLNDKLNVPVGLIGSYWGGTCVQAWMPRTIFDKDSALMPLTRNIEPYGWAAKGSSLLFNTMINPLTPYRLAGVIWYQGEANVASESTTYGKLFSALIKSWRLEFDNNFPFYYVQIAPWKGYLGINGALLREQQEKVLKIPKTGIVAVGDLVNDVTDIHPKAKKAVGNRLADLALKEQYGFSKLQPYFPRFHQSVFDKNSAIIKVSSVGKLHVGKNGIKNFQIAGPDRIFFPATAVLAKNGDIRLTAMQVSKAVAVRYCFTNDAVPDLFDVNGLPLLPFRTDYDNN